MTIPLAADGNGAVLTFGSFTGNIISVDSPALKRAAIDKTHLGSVDTMESFPAKLCDPGEVSLEMEFDPQTLPPILDDPQALSIQFPFATPVTWSWTDAFMTSFKAAQVKSGEKMTASATIKLNGLPSIS